MDDWKGEDLIRSVRRDGHCQQSRHTMRGMGGVNMPHIKFGRKRRPSGELRAEILAEFERGLSPAAIAEKLNVRRDTVHWYCAKAGLRFRERDG